MLTFPDEETDRSPRDVLLETWQSQLDDAIPRERQAAARRLLEGQGGKYDDDLLGVRAAMFSTLVSVVQGEARDFELLNRALVRALSLPPFEPSPA
jgi:hypothetical protein